MTVVIRQSGFSLLELLIALVVFSVGLLSIAGLQTVSKQSNFEALQRTTASQIAHGLLEDMRTNGDAIGLYLSAGELGGGSRGASPAPNCGPGNECNTMQKAAYDLWFWEQILDGTLEMSGGNAAGGLVLPTLCIQGPGGPVAGIYRVTIVWRGTAAHTATNNTACGATSGNYGTNNQSRRVVEIPTYLDPTL